MSPLAAYRLALLLVTALAALHGAAADAQELPRAAVPTDPDVERIRAAYEYGRYADVLERAQERIDRGGLPREGLIELHKYAGLAAFHEGKRSESERHFAALLRLDPDHALDPFAVPPPAIAAFEAVRKELAPQLELIRQQLRLDEERVRREGEARELARRAEEERRRRIEEMSRRVTVRTIHQRSFLVNFVPFGAGQFQQGRPVAGWVLASLQGALALTSIVAYLAYDQLLERRSVVVDTISRPLTLTQEGIPPEKVNQAKAWRVVKYASAGAFYTMYGYGVVDALYHHERETISESSIQLPPEPEQPAPAQPPPEAPPAPDPHRVHSKAAAPRGFLFPTSGGLGAGFTLQF
jgi:tetratricopeptide (TPR) repeat protein